MSLPLSTRRGGVSVYPPPPTAVPLHLPCAAAGSGFGGGRRRGCLHSAAAASLSPCRCAPGPRLWRHADVAACLDACVRLLSWGRRGCSARAPPRLITTAARASADDGCRRQRPSLLALPTPSPKDNTATASRGSSAPCFCSFARAAFDGSLPRGAVFSGRNQPLRAGGGVPQRRRQIASARL